MCAVDHPQHNKNFSWDHNLGHGWITLGPFTSTVAPFNGSIQKNTGFDNIVKLNCLELLKLFTYLEFRGFSYFYMLIDENVLLDSPEWFLRVLEKYKNHRALSSGMAEFVKQYNAVDQDGWHPSKDGHKLIADKIFSFINKHELTKHII